MSSKMKIAHINPGVRGVATYSLNLNNSLIHDENVENLIISSSQWKKQSCNVFEPNSKLVFNVLPWVKNVKEVEEKLEAFEPNIIHHHHPSGRLDFHLENFKKKFDVPTLCTVHMSVGAKKYATDLVMHSFFMMARKNFKNINAYVAISQGVKKQLEEIGGVPKEKIVLLYAGVDPNIFKPVEYEEHDTLEVLFVGQVMHEKGIDLLIKVVNELAAVKKVRLTIVGIGHLKEILERKTKNCPEVNWVGYVKGSSEIAKYYAQADVVVMPNRWEEAFSYVPLEAMSAGSAIIASRKGGNIEAIEHGRTGYLFDVDNPKELFDLLKNTEIKQFWEMGRNGREEVLKKYTLELFGQKYKSLYENLLTNPYQINQID
jgi:glycosyltransferase involved in cell wall biosynthesis